jgi:hypothetical protein
VLLACAGWVLLANCQRSMSPHAGTSSVNMLLLLQEEVSHCADGVRWLKHPHKVCLPSCSNVCFCTLVCYCRERSCTVLMVCAG